MKTLLLNATYEPLSVIPLKKAVSLLNRGKVVAVGDAVNEVQTGSTIVNIPRVLRLMYYVNVPRKRVRWSRRSLFDRDNCACAYCGATKAVRDLTVDHVVPVSQGGKTTWTNTVAACLACNRRKGNQTPKQANMPLLFKPQAPRGNLLVFSGQIPHDWAVYINL